MERNKEAPIEIQGPPYVDEKGRLLQRPDILIRLQNFGALYWEPKEIALYFGVSDIRWWENQISDPTSWISLCIYKGQYETRAALELKTLQGALSGDPAELAKYNELVRDKSFSISKLDLFGGTDKLSSWEIIQQYVSTGASTTLSVKEQRYIDLLSLVYRLDGQMGKRAVVKILSKPPFDFTYEQAVRTYSESVELFYANRSISRKALQAKTADCLEALYHQAVQSAKTSKDYLAAAEILKTRAQLLRLDEPEIQKLPAELYHKRFTVVTINPEDIGLPAADRVALSRQIDAIADSDEVRTRLRQDAGIEDFDIVKRLRDESQEAV